MNLNDFQGLITGFSIIVVLLTFVLVAIIGFLAITKFMKLNFGRVRRSEEHAYTQLLSSHERKYHTPAIPNEHEHYVPQKSANGKTII